MGNEREREGAFTCKATRKPREDNARLTISQTILVAEPFANSCEDTTSQLLFAPLSKLLSELFTPLIKERRARRRVRSVLSRPYLSLSLSLFHSSGFRCLYTSHPIFSDQSHGHMDTHVASSGTIYSLPFPFSSFLLNEIL